MQFLKDTKIDFIGKKYLCYALSVLMIAAGIGALIIKGPAMSIEFTGGTLLQVGFKRLPEIEKLRAALNQDGWDGYALQTQAAEHSVIVRVKHGNQSKDDVAEKMMATFKKNFADNVKYPAERVEFIGPVIGRKLAWDALKAIFGSLIVIVAYVAFRFKNWIWGIVGVLALAHDVFITFGLLVLLDREITLVVIAALLTLAGYSINDTIVIFDRVRENLRISRKETIGELYNRSLNETLSRTIITSFIAFLSAGSLFFAGDIIRDFALTMTFGVIIGSYSTIFVAIALIHQWETKLKRR